MTSSTTRRLAWRDAEKEAAGINEHEMFVAQTGCRKGVTEPTFQGCRSTDSPFCITNTSSFPWQMMEIIHSKASSFYESVNLQNLKCKQYTK